MLRAIKRGQNAGKMVPANRLAQHTVVTNLQFVKSMVSVTRNRATAIQQGKAIFCSMLCLTSA